MCVQEAIALAALLGIGLVLICRGSGSAAAPVPDAPTPQAPTAAARTRWTHHARNWRRQTALPAQRTRPSAATQPPAPAETAPPPPPPSNQSPASRLPISQPAGTRQCGNDRTTSCNVNEVRFRSRSRTPRAIWSPASPGATSRSTRTTPASRCASSAWIPRPLSVAFVIDQTLPSNVMRRGEQIHGRHPGRAHSLRRGRGLHLHQRRQGVDRLYRRRRVRACPPCFRWRRPPAPIPMVPIQAAPLCRLHHLDQTAIAPDPNLQPGDSTQTIRELNIPKEIHTLNDAILARPRSFPRVPRSAAASST